jgi:hypothetical protein
MADPFRDREPSSLPRWVKVSAVIAAVIALLIVVMMLVDGGDEHGPSRHGLGWSGAAAPASASPSFVPDLERR